MALRTSLENNALDLRMVSHDTCAAVFAAYIVYLHYNSNFEVLESWQRIVDLHCIGKDEDSGSKDIYQGTRGRQGVGCDTNLLYDLPFVLKSKIY